MRPSRLFLTCLFALLFYVHIAQSSYVQVQNFDTIVISWNETCYLDLNDYFEGNISVFTVDPPLSVPVKFKEIDPSKKFLYTFNSSVEALQVTKVIFGDWVVGGYWAFLDNNNTLYFFNYTAQSFDLVGSPLSFINDTTTNYTCGAMTALSTNTIVVSCLTRISETENRAAYFSVTMGQNNSVNASLLETVYDGNMKLLSHFPENNHTLISWSKCDPSGFNQGPFAALNDINGTFLLNLSPDSFLGGKSCIQDIAVINKTIFFADYSGTIYRAVDPLDVVSRGDNHYLSINDNILKMIAMNNTYAGQPTTTLLIQSPTAIYYYDWTDIKNPIFKNKYIVSSTGVQSIKYLEMSQDFITTIVATGADEYNLYTFYIHQNLPGDVYYSQTFENIPDFVDSSRPQNLFLFFTMDPKSFSLSLSIHQLQRSILQISSPTAGNYTQTLTIDGQAATTINYIVIDPADPQVYIQQYNQVYGLTVPGQSTFEITDLLSGPLLDYHSSSPSYQVLLPFKNLMGPSSTDTPNNFTVDQTKPYDFFSAEDSDSLYLFFVDPLDTTGTKVNFVTCTGLSQEIQGLDSVNADLNLTCSQTSFSAGNKVVDIAVDQTYVYYLMGTSISATNYLGDQKGNPIVIVSGLSKSCYALEASHVPDASFLYCITDTNIFIIPLANWALAPNIPSASWNIPTSPPSANDWTKNVTMQLSSNFPSILFVLTQNTVFLIDSFAAVLASNNSDTNANVVLSTIHLHVLDTSGFNFSIGGQSLLVMRYYDSSLFEYDISHPNSPVLVKTVIPAFHVLNQFISDSQDADNIYIYALTEAAQAPIGLVYKPQRTGNSNYWAELPLTSPFNPSFPYFIPSRFSGISKNGYELFILPNNQQIGWIVRSDTEVAFYTESDDNSDVLGYEQSLQVTFTGTFRTGSAVGSVGIDVILANEIVRATESYYYDSSIKLTSEMNTFSFDPRNFFNGTIYSYDKQAEDGSDDQFITLLQQARPGTNISLTDDIYELTTIDDTIVAQQAKTLLLIASDDSIKPVDLSPNYDLTCERVEYNSDLAMILSICHNETDYYFVFTNFTDIAKPPSFFSSSGAGKTLTRITKTIFTYGALFVLENDPATGDFIHVFEYSAPIQLKFSVTMTSADLNANNFQAADFAINYRGSSTEYRLFIVDPAFGLRTVEVEFSNIVSFQNPELITLEGPDNVEWSGVIIIQEDKDIENPLDLLITSSNYKNYFVEYQVGKSITLQRTFVAVQNVSNLVPCYSDHSTFILSAVSGSANYVLFYSITNITATANSQDFPLMNATYTIPSSSIVRTCGFAYNPNAASGPELYVVENNTIGNWTVTPNITLQINGNIASDYITITGYSGPTIQDSFKYYLVPPPNNSPSLVFVYIIVGVIGIVIVIILICYCTMKYRKKVREENYSQIHDESVGAN